ncbi:unnamed protein product [Brugia timori]|uniref:RING-type domain-containing protein n=1 Tax=Brugia timori TaxID=42155 RepID=A0A0R3RBF1_9BILA|nr:unnamed protein product [Brugia timori]
MIKSGMMNKYNKKHSLDRLLGPCNHIFVCADCVEELLETYEEPLCPLCRSVITSYVDVYI